MINSRRKYNNYNGPGIYSEDSDPAELNLRDKSINGILDSDLGSLLGSNRIDSHRYNLAQIQKSNFYAISTKSPGDYRKIDLMYRFYRICNNLKIQNPDKIYNMYLKRLNKRIRLESSNRKLEIIISALYYIDQCLERGNNYTLRDVLLRIPDCKVNLKSFTRFVSKLASELGIKSLPVIDDTLLITNILDQIRLFCSDHIIASGKDNPQTTTTVINMNELFDLEEIMSSLTSTPTSLDSTNLSCISTENSQNSVDNILHTTIKHDNILDNDESVLDHSNEGTNYENTPNRTSNGPNKIPNSDITTVKSHSSNIARDTACYKQVCKSISLNFVKILKLSGRILGLVDETSRKENVLNPQNRVIFACRKTLIASVLFMTFSALKIPVTPNLIIRALNVVKSSFYRNYNKVLSRMMAHFTTKYSCKINDKDNLMSLLHVLLTNNMATNTNDTVTTVPNSDQKMTDGIVPNIIKKENIFNGRGKSDRKTSFSKTIACLDILTNIHDNGKGKGVIVYERSANRYVCRYKIKGKIKRKCFSVNYHGQKTAYELAIAYSKHISN
uniref:Transcriptional adaptor (ADA2 homologue), putative n=1 Tax=Theileria annulata TaxID=5874 RepID=A0A3B0MN15_THEAN